jgi:hypothetical protein
MARSSDPVLPAGVTTDAGHDRLQFGIRRPDGPPPFYSELLRRVEGVRMSTARPQAWLDWLRGLPRAGVSPDEIDSACLREWLEIQDGKVSKAAIVSYLREAGVQVDTVLLSNVADDEHDSELGGVPRYWGYPLIHAGGTNDRELLLVLSIDGEPARSSKHWRDIPNVLAHVRTNEYADDDGQAVLFLIEAQSDWQQSLRQGRKVVHRAVREGFKGLVERLMAAGVLAVEPDGRYVYRGQPYAKGELRDALRAMPLHEAAPHIDRRIDPEPDLLAFNSTDRWVTLALKRVLRLAVDKGYSRVAIIDGATARGDMQGKAGAGLATFYDRVLPAIAKDLLRKLGGGLRPVFIGGREYVGFDIPPSMAERVRGGLPLF